MKEKMQRLIELARNVSDTYDDFVSGLHSDLYDEPILADQMVAFMEQHPTANTSDIIQHLNKLEHIDESAALPVDSEGEMVA